MSFKWKWIIVVVSLYSCKVYTEPIYLESKLQITEEVPLKAYHEVYLSEEYIVFDHLRFEVRRTSHTRNIRYYDCVNLKVTYYPRRRIIEFYKDQQKITTLIESP